jgi:hypothetical protein
MWIWWSCHCPPPAPGTKSTVPEQCWVPLSRTDVVWTATVAAWLDWLMTFALLKVMERSPAWPVWKFW